VRQKRRWHAFGNWSWLNRRRLEQQLSVRELAEKSGLSIGAIYNIELGRSQNPQNKTVKKLERALGKTLSEEAKEEAKDEATIEGVGEWFNFDPHNNDDWPLVAGIFRDASVITWRNFGLEPHRGKRCFCRDRQQNSTGTD
jgi:transcriptional regulator with XRE-family HTH domain